MAGAGVLVAPDTVVTCAHVVEAALGLARTDEPPGGNVELGFLALPPGQRSVAARVPADGWFRAGPVGDLAVLKLEVRAPAGSGVAPTARCGVGVGLSVRVFGHPAEAPSGLWARARIAGAGGPHPGWWQLDGADVTGARIERGFSGAGVWNADGSAVLGVLASVLATAGADTTRVAWMIPLDLLDGTPYEVPRTAAGPPCDDARPGDVTRSGDTARPQADPRPHEPRRWPDNRPRAGVRSAAVAPSRAALWALAESLLAVESVAADGGAALLSLLPRDLAGSIRRDPKPRFQLFHVVQRCGEFERGPAELVAAVRWAEGETRAMEQFAALAGETWPDRFGDHD